MEWFLTRQAANGAVTSQRVGKGGKLVVAGGWFAAGS